MAKESRYHTTKGSKADAFADLTAKLSDDLMTSVSAVGSKALFTDAWFELGPHFTRLAHVSDVEQSMAADGKDGKGTTLWETEEQALRYLVEDGKINILMREMVQFKEKQREMSYFADYMSERQTCCDAFERGVGTILRNAWCHTEVIQTTDVDLAARHIGNTLALALVFPVRLLEHDEVHQLQEVVVLQYLRLLLLAADDIGEERYVGTFRRQGVLVLGCKLLLVVHAQLPKSVLLHACHGLSLLTETEDFSTYKAAYLGTPEDLPLLERLQTDVLAALLDDFDCRKSVRGLSTGIDAARRQHGRRK